ncbi:hypothetical protein RUND412_010586 [Rhizina undulata]
MLSQPSPVISSTAASTRPCTEKDAITKSTVEENSPCHICAGTTFYDPVECVECRHTFCGSCIIESLDEEEACGCRGCGVTWCGNFWYCEGSEDTNLLTLAKMTASSIGISEMEFLELSLYVDANGITWNELGRRVRDWLFETKDMLPCQYRKKDRSYMEDYDFLPSDYMCRACMKFVFQDFVLEWWRFQYKLIYGSGEL